MTSIATLEQTVDAYVRIRDLKRDLADETAKKIAEYDSDLKELTLYMLEKMQEVGADSIRTSTGTIIKSVKTKYWTNNWDAMWSFIRQNSAMELLEKRLHQTNMKQFLEENKDLHPPGLNVDSEYVVTIRKNKS